MVTNAETEERDDEQGMRLEQIEAGMRSLIAGHPQGAVRRIILYCAAMLLVGLAPAFGTVVAVPALVVIMLLATTDVLV